VAGLLTAVKERNEKQIHAFYETSWNKISEKFFKTGEWPSAESVAGLAENNPTVLFMYRELSYRHIHARLQKQLTIVHRFGAWRNYQTFFKTLLEAETAADVVLPVSWIWDTIDEFIYQYEEFSQYRSRAKDLHAEESKLMAENPQVWNTVGVLKILSRIIEKSEIKKVLENEKAGVGASSVSLSVFASSELYQWFGYFSIIGLCRLHVITGDYYLAVKTLDQIDIDQKKVRYAKITGAYITIHYYLGFSYLMMRRYRDALKIFERVLLYISRMKQFHTRQYDQKKSDKMYALMAILLSFCPRRIDENVNNLLRLDHNDKLVLMANGEAEQLFSYASPKFVSPAVADGDDHGSLLALQKKGFLREAAQQAQLPVVRSYLKLYSSVTLDKLAALLGKSDKETLRWQLLSLIHKNQQVQWKSGLRPIEGEMKPAVSVQFLIDGDMVYLLDASAVRQFGEHFLRGITKLNAIDADLQ
jgi:translation initiation factor 3 subunit L